MSNKTSALTRDQFEAIVVEFHRRGDTRMEIICLLLGRCVRVGDVLRTLLVSNVYTPAGTPRDVIGFNEEKTGKWRTIQVGNHSRLQNALSEYTSTVTDGVLFAGMKTKKALCAVGVKKLLAEFIGWRGIEQCSPHSFRIKNTREIL